MLPRPDMEALGVNYRRSPVMSVGRDMYVDSRMILQRLEELFPPSAEHPALSTKETAGLAGLLNKFAVDAGVFARAVQTMPLHLPTLRNEKFMKDRAAFFGGRWDLQVVKEGRPDGLAHVRQCFDIAESLFVDGRIWVGGTPDLTLADLEGKGCRDEGADGR